MNGEYAHQNRLEISNPFELVLKMQRHVEIGSYIAHVQAKMLKFYDCEKFEIYLFMKCD